MEDEVPRSAMAERALLVSVATLPDPISPKGMKVPGHLRAEFSPTGISVPASSSTTVVAIPTPGSAMGSEARTECNGSSRIGFRRRDQITNIACIGAGYVGGPTSAVMALKNPEIDVTVVDMDVERIAAWNSLVLPFHEPGLEEMVVWCRDGISSLSNSSSTVVHRSTGDVLAVATETEMPSQRRPNLRFTTNMDVAIRQADLIIISVDTPTKRHGPGKGLAPDLTRFESAARAIARFSQSDKIVVEKSTVPCGTAEVLRGVLEAYRRPGVRYEILSNPEFMAEGTAVDDLLHPDRIIIGSSPTEAGHRAAASLADVYASWVSPERIVTMNLWSSELSKLAANALLAQRISSINALSAICEKTGADIDDVARACGLDSRLGSRMLKAGPGFGGSCFRKDVLSLVDTSESLHLDEVASYWKSVVTMNEYQKARISDRILSCLSDPVPAGTKIAVLGFAYKSGTSDTRESAAIDVVGRLIAEGVDVAIYDPAAGEPQILAELQQRITDDASSTLGHHPVSICRSAYEACQGAHAVVILTEWEEFTTIGASSRVSGCVASAAPTEEGRPSDDGPSLDPPRDDDRRRRDDAPATSSPSPSPASGDGESSDLHLLPRSRPLDWRRIAFGMDRPRLVFDGRGMVDARYLEHLGFRVEVVGQASRQALYWNALSS